MFTVHGVTFQHQYCLRGQVYRLTGWFGWAGNEVIARLAAADGSQCLVGAEGEPLRCILARPWYQVVPDEQTQIDPTPVDHNNSQEGQEQ
jgi:hypothetical protein